jgi:cell division protein FtsA
MSSRDDIYVGVDIGSSKIAITVGQYTEEKGWDVVGVGKSTASGVRKGVIVNIEETISDFSSAMEQVERMAGMEVSHAVFGVGEANISSMESKGVVAISRADGEITEEDIGRVIDASKAVSVPTNFEILHVIPKSFTVDGQRDISDPVGMTGIRLEVDTHIILSSTATLKSLRRCAQQLNIEIDAFVYSAFASGEIALTKQDKDLGVLLVDIGSHTTEVAVFEEGNIIYASVIPIGSNHITNDLAIGLRTSLPVAEAIKLHHAVAIGDRVELGKDIDLKKFDPTEDQVVGKKFVSEICEARLGEIFAMIKKDLKKINRDGTLPAGMVITGGGSKMPHVVDLAKDSLKLPARISQPQVEMSGLVDKLSDPVYTCSTGLMLWSKHLQGGGGGYGLPVNFKSLGKATDTVRGWFKNFIP